MKEKNNKFSIISEIYSQFSEKNKENLITTAKSLLAIQRKDNDKRKEKNGKGKI